MSISYIGGMKMGLEALAVPLDPAPTRISPPPVPPEASFPFLTLQQIVGEEEESLAELSDLTSTHIQLNCWSTLYDEAFALRAALVRGLQTISGPIGSSGLAIDTITQYRYTELFDPARELHQLILRVRVWWTVP